MEIAAEIRTYLLSELAPDREDMTLEPDDDLVELGIVDSLGILSLAAFIEKKYDIEVTELEMVADNFSSIERIERYLQSKGAT